MAIMKQVEPLKDLELVVNEMLDSAVRIKCASLRRRPDLLHHIKSALGMEMMTPRRKSSRSVKPAVSSTRMRSVAVYEQNKGKQIKIVERVRAENDIFAVIEQRFINHDIKRGCMMLKMTLLEFLTMVWTLWVHANRRPKGGGAVIMENMAQPIVYVNHYIPQILQKELERKICRNEGRSAG